MGLMIPMFQVNPTEQLEEIIVNTSPGEKEATQTTPKRKVLNLYPNPTCAMCPFCTPYLHTVMGISNITPHQCHSKVLNKGLYINHCPMKGLISSGKGGIGDSYLLQGTVMTTEPPSTQTTETSTSPATTSDTTASSSSGACGVGRGDFNERLVEVALRRSLFMNKPCQSFPKEKNGARVKPWNTHKQHHIRSNGSLGV